MIVPNRRVHFLLPLSVATALVVLSMTLNIDLNHDTASAATMTSLPSFAGFPNFKGMTLAEARTVASKHHGSVIVQVTVPSSTASGIILGQGPNPQWPVRLVVSSGPWRNDWAVLPGAHNSPVKKECVVPVLLTEDGNAFPLLCHGGRVNVGAWLFYGQLRPSIMAMERNATPRQVFTQVCNLLPDMPKGFNLNLTLPEYENSYSLAAAYNGWKFPEIARWAEIITQNVSPSKCVADFLKPR
jgi:hypothetical protein